MESTDWTHWPAAPDMLRGLCCGTGVITVDLLLGTAGETVTFKTSLKPTAEQFLAVTWSINGSNIITSTSADVIGEDYKNRIHLDKSTGSLQLTHLTERDSGEYELIIIPYGAGQIQGAAKLEVYFRVPRPTMACPTAKLIEDRNSIELTCNVDGSVSSRMWTKDGTHLVSGDRYKFHDGGRVLSISPVKRTDTGQFLCNVSNPISFETTLCSLTVNYGPDKPTISQFPAAVEEEEMVTLTCSADSFPKAIFTWIFKDRKTYGPLYHLQQLEEHHLGRYTCTARNAVSGQEASEVHTLSDTSTPISGSMYVMVGSVLTLVGLRLV
ncbi:cell adhesion molecule CEACAM1-like [Genypterus blacodes]|uniref:cell adhesion molecule CEACAM1-like n=1 Tax=Genypterus blacodes TaxID=154954 RepID=UPI003F771181